MFKYYNYALIISNRSYSLEEFCNLYKDKKIHIQTLRKWIKDNKLPLIRKNPILIHGSVLKNFLYERSKNNKVTMQFDHFKCVKCRMISRPNNDQIAYKNMPNGALNAIANCRNCHSITNRLYAKNSLSDLKKTFSIKPKEVIINNSLCISAKYSFEYGDKLHQKSLIKDVILDVNSTENKASILHRYSNQEYNCFNERIKYEFFKLLEHAMGRSIKTIQSFANGISEYEKYTSYEDFKKFELEKAIDFKKYLSDKVNKRTGESISKSYLQHYASHVRIFFEWLCKQKGYKNIRYNDVQYFNLSKNDRNKASAVGYQESYEIGDIIDTVLKMEDESLVNKRNKAMISLCLLTAPRISALQTARVGSIKYFKFDKVYAFVQNPNLVDTKYAKNITSYFVGNNTEIYNNVLHWQEYLRGLGFHEKDYLFPRFASTFTSDSIKDLNLTREMIKSQSTVREIFKNAFENNDLDYINPHSFRHSLTRRALNIPEAKYLSALSGNFGHRMDSVILSSYGTIPEVKRGIILKEFPLK